MRICFLLSAFSRSGGVNAVLQHSRWLHEDHGFEITLALLDDAMPTETHGAEQFAEIVLLRDLSVQQPFDIAIATYWETAFWIYDIPARRYAHFLQSLEDRFFPARTPARTLARMSEGLPLAIVTEATWIAETMREVRGDEEVLLVRNGIDKDVFPPLAALPERADGPLRIVVEGHPEVWFKSVPEAKAVLERMTAPFEAVFVVPEPAKFAPLLGAVGTAEGPLTGEQLRDRYEWADVILKLSRVEGMFGPPLEAFHRGATCVVWPVTGHDEYIVHGENGIVTDWDDLAGTARWLDILAGDRTLLRRLQLNALETAQRWPDWRSAAAEMKSALTTIAAGPETTNAEALALLSESIRAAMGQLDRYAGAMGLMEGDWSPSHHRVWELEAEVERMGGRRKERAIRFAKKAYRRLRPVPADQGTA